MKPFDFEQVGKRMPYTVPDDFFNKLEENVMEDVMAETAKSKNRKKILTVTIRSVTAIAAALALFFVVQPLMPKNNTADFESVELAFNNLSTDDQDYLIAIYEDDDLLIYDFENP